MTSAHEVHLFDWIRVNVGWIGALLAVMWAMTVFWYKTVINKFYSKEIVEDRIDTKLSKCKLAVDNDTKAILGEIKSLSAKVDHLDDRRREDAMANSAEHGSIRHEIMMAIKKEP